MKRVRKPTAPKEIDYDAKQYRTAAPRKRAAAPPPEPVAPAAPPLPPPPPLSMATSVTLSSRDKARQIELSEDQLSCTGCEGGYRMVRATHGVHSGAYFWEAEIQSPVKDENAHLAHVRIGWSTRQGELQGPVGYDKYSFGYTDVVGAKIHASLREDNYGEIYGSGDIVGCYIYLNDMDPESNEIRFFRNGKDQGVAYSGSELPPGVYFPAISLYMKARVNVNFGPSFVISHDIYGANAVSEVQPLSPADRAVHERRIAGIRKARLQSMSSITTASVPSQIQSSIMQNSQDMNHSKGNEKDVSSCNHGTMI